MTSNSKRIMALFGAEILALTGTVITTVAGMLILAGMMIFKIFDWSAEPIEMNGTMWECLVMLLIGLLLMIIAAVITVTRLHSMKSSSRYFSLAIPLVVVSFVFTAVDAVVNLAPPVPTVVICVLSRLSALLMMACISLGCGGLCHEEAANRLVWKALIVMGASMVLSAAGSILFSLYAEMSAACGISLLMTVVCYGAYLGTLLKTAGILKKKEC